MAVVINTLHLTIIKQHLNSVANPHRRWFAFVICIVFSILILLVGQGSVAAVSMTGSLSQPTPPMHDAVFNPGPAFDVGKVAYLSSHDFDPGSETDTCLSVNVPPGDTFTLSLTWEALVPGPQGAGDLDLYLYSDSSCSPSSLVTSSFNSNAYTDELLEITPQVRNIGSTTAIAGIRIGRRTGRGIPGSLSLRINSGAAVFAEHGTDGPPLENPEAPVFAFTGPFEVAENSPPSTVVGSVTATISESSQLTFFELAPAEGQETFQIHPLSGVITVEDPTALDREAVEAVTYWIGITDGVATSVIDVGVGLIGVNDNPPIARNKSAYTTPDIPVEITLSGTDVDVGPSQQLKFAILDFPGTGLLGPVNQSDAGASTVVYSPPQGFAGTETFTFDVSDGTTRSVPAKVTIHVSDQPAMPTPIPTHTPEVSVTATVTSTDGDTPSVAPSPPLGIGAGSGGGLTILPDATVIPTGLPPNVTPPSAPRFLRAEAGDGQVALKWQRPLFDGGAPIDGYRIFNVNTAHASIFRGDVTTAELGQLENDTGYLFQVRGFNSAGMGDAALVGPVTPASGQLGVLEVDSSLHPDDTVTIWWSAPQKMNDSVVSLYRVWLEDGELLEIVPSGQPLITNADDLEPDTWHSFRVAAFDEDGAMIASGVTEPVYLPPTLASMYNPPPREAIFVNLQSHVVDALHMALRSVVSRHVDVGESALALVTVKNGETHIFVKADGLHRSIVLPPVFAFDSGQWSGSSIDDGLFAVELELATGVWVVGEASLEIDPTGLLFRLHDTDLLLKLDGTSGGELQSSIEGFEIVYSVKSLASEFSFDISASVELPAAVSESLQDLSSENIAGLIEVLRSGMAVSEPAFERVAYVVETFWHDWQLASGRTIGVSRIDANGYAHTQTAECEIHRPFDSTRPSLPALTTCSAVLNYGSGSTAYYVLHPIEPGMEPESAPLDAPTDVPSATPASSLIVVEGKQSPSGASADASPRPTATFQPASSDPVLPETGGGLSPVTWLMSGLLGIVVIRGAFYAVGRIRA